MVISVAIMRPWLSHLGCVDWLFILSKRGKNSDTAWLQKWRTKNERNMKMRTITCFGDRTSSTFLIIASVSRMKITRSHGPLTLWMFSAVFHLLLYSYCCVLHYFLTMPVVFNFNLTFGIKPQVGGIKIVTVSKRSIFQVEWLIATLILLLCLGLFLSTKKPFPQMYFCCSRWNVSWSASVQYCTL